MLSLALEKDRKRCLIRCGGGTKKKVLDAIALIGNPDIIILDEPTTGLDLFSKRLMWDFLLEYCGGKKTVLLTTPWLEEAEALGTKIGILEHGNLRYFDFLKCFIYISLAYSTGSTNNNQDVHLMMKLLFSVPLAPMKNSKILEKSTTL